MRNLTFNKDYYKEEMIGDFKLSSVMKHVWAEQIEVLHTITQICETENISYFADWGTLLGTVRHKGFVPWDDDIDICMKRSDYNRFLSIIGEKIPTEYQVLNMYFNDQYDTSFMRIVNGAEINTSSEWLKKHHGCPFTVGIDIFPLDYIPCNEEEANVQREILRIIYLTLQRVNDKSKADETVLLIREIEELCQVKIEWNGKVQNQLLQLIDNISSIYREEESDRLTYFGEHALNESYALKKEWYNEFIYMPFENIQIRVPKEYDEVLTVLYGDYMTPAKDIQVHDYPFYKGQEEILLEFMKKDGDNRTIEEVVADYI